MPLSPPAQIELADVTLRAWSVVDADSLGAALVASDAHLRPWTPWVIDGRVPGLSLEERLAQHAVDFGTGAAWVWGMFDREGAVLGGCGLYPRVGPRAVEIGYWLAAGHTGRGLATRAAWALTRLAFASPDIDHVEIRCERRNEASARVPRRLGYRIDHSLGSGGMDDLMIWRMDRAAFASLPNES